MSNQNINSNFYKIANVDANSEVIGISSPISSMHITGGSANQAIITDGAGNLRWGAVGGIPGGNTSQLQYNANGTFAGIANVTFDGSNLHLGSVSDILITGGNTGNFLTTDGTGNLSWSGLTSIPYAQSIVGANGATYSWTSSVFDLYTSNTDINLFYNGVLVNPDAFTLTGNTLTFLYPVRTNDVLAVPTRTVSGVVNSTGGGSTPAGSDTYVQYNNNGAFGASSSFTYNSGTQTLTVPRASYGTGAGAVFVGTTGPSTNVTTVEIGTAGYGGVLYSHNGTERWYAGKTSENNGDGNFVINTSGQQAFKITTTSNVGTVLANTYITGVTSTRSFEYRCQASIFSSQTSLGPGRGAQSAVIANTIPGLTFITSDNYNTGYYRNDGPARKFNFDFMTTLTAYDGGTLSPTVLNEADIWFQKNATSVSSQNRYGQQTLLLPAGQTLANALMSTSQTFVLNTGDTVSIWAYCAGPNTATFVTGHAAFGLDNGYATKLVITEVL